MPDYRALAYANAVKYGIDPSIFVAQIQQESDFSPTAYNKASGATGIAQIMPKSHPSVDATDPAASLDYAARLMAGFLQQYNGDYAKALAAYNAGAGNVAKYGGVPPFAETQAYVKKIMSAKPLQEEAKNDPDEIYAGRRGSGMTPEQLAEIVQGHGGQTGAIAIDPITTDAEGIKSPNYTPQYRLTFADGTSMTVKPQATWVNDGGEANITGWDVTDWGTAAGPKAPKDPPVPTIRDDPSGNPYQYDPNSNQWVPAPGMPTAAASAPKGTQWQDPSDGSQWLIDGQGNKTKQLSPAIPGWTPGLGVRWPAQPAAPAPQYPNVFTQGRSAYKSDPYTGEVTKVYDFEEALPTAWDREKEANDKWYKQETLDAQREANRRSAENAAFGHISNLWTSSLPYAVRPGQKQPVGFEAGGPYARLLGMAGSPYNPADYEMPVQQLDPLGMYRQAQTMINQQGGK